MARSKLTNTKAKTKLKATRAPKNAERVAPNRGLSGKIIEERHTGPEITWERGVALSPEEMHDKTARALNYYNYHFSPKDLKRFVVQYLKEHLKLPKSELEAYETAEDWRTVITVCSLCRMWNLGAPLTDKQHGYIKSHTEKAIAVGKERLEEKRKADKLAEYKPNIQDRLRDQLSDVIADLEELEDVVINTRKLPDTKVFDYLKEKSVPQQFVGKIVAFYARRQAELKEAEKGKDPQLNEAYAKYTKKDFKVFGDFYDKLIADANAYGNTKKATRKPRVKKAVSKDKIVAKVRYCKDSTQYKLASVDPTKIIGCEELWVFNIKTRKLGRYVANTEYGSILGIKGSAVTGFDPTKSMSKTLRKPEEMLQTILKASKPATRKSFESIKAVAALLNGRLSQDTILLKVY
jgi:hypothetical protein